DGCEARARVRELAPRGSTNLYDGLMLGFRVAAGSEERGRATEGCDERSGREPADLPDRARTRRVLLRTDGIANTGVTLPARIVADARPFEDSGIDLSTIGVGADLNDDLLRTLARGGRGLYHFVASGEDLEKVFVDDLQSLLAPVARHARLEVELA